MRIPSVAQLRTAFTAEGLAWPTGFHIVLLRNKNGKVDAFDDMLCAVNGDTLVAAMRCTTDPGKGPRTNPKNPKGCAVWAPGQVVDGLGWGKHHGDYVCFVPVKPIPVDRYDSLGDTTPTRSTSLSTQVHRASATHESTVVGAYSEGCVVVANPGDFDVLVAAARKTGQTRFTPTLIEWAG
jgi:hypothetical protein